MKQRERLIQSVEFGLGEPQRSSKRRAVGTAYAFAVAAMVLIVCGIRWSHTQRAVHATWNGATVYGPSVIEAATNRPQSLEFSEGSQVLLEPDTRVSLAPMSAHNTDLTLDDGHILANIRKHTGITWTFVAGPYRIRVVGTRFTIDWDCDRRQLRVAVREGRVKVSGGDLPNEGLVLDAGTALERGASTDHAKPSVQTEIMAPAELSAASNSPPRAPTKELMGPARVAGNSVAGPTWSALANQGKYHEALALAETLGFDTLINEVSENDLLLLANAARYSGDTPRAHQAQLKLRERFAGRRSAALAAFYLARSGLDIEHRPDIAIQWFETFLTESPRGDLAALARAHLMSLWLNRGQREKARRIALDYLRYHPDGAQAAQARSLVQSVQ
jgi:TolA-binding protein